MAYCISHTLRHGSPPTIVLLGEPAWQSLAEDYLASLTGRRYAKGTAETYRLHLSRLLGALSAVDPAHCATGDVRLAIDQVRALWPDSYQSANSRCMLINVCRSFFRWAVEAGLVMRNPAAAIIVRHGEGVATMPISLSDIQRLLTTIKASNDRNRHRDEALFAFYAFTGVRRNEALSVTAGDYQREQGTVLIRGKGGSRKRLPVIAPLRQILDAYLALMAISAADAPLFSGKSAVAYAALSGRQADKLFHKWRRLAALPMGLTIHSFRAGFASTLYNDNHDLLLVSRLLGHRDIRTTCRYITVLTDARLSLEHAFTNH